MTILKNGSQGTEVANWQRFLLAHGFTGIEADGDFGPKTVAATKEFQAANDLDVDGQVGPATLAKAQSLPQVTIHASALPSLIPAPSTSKPAGKLSKVHPNLAAKVEQVIALAKAEGYTLNVSQGLRTFAEQDALFRQRPKVTNARGGQSLHNYGLAVDVVFVIDGRVSWDEKYYRKIGPWAASVELEWGGNWRSFKDLPHLQLPNLPSYRDLLPVYNSGGLPRVWEKFVK